MARRALALALLSAALATEAQAFRPRLGPMSRGQTLRGTVEVPVSDRRDEAAPIDTLRALYPALAACWQAPEGLAKFERAEITARFALRRDGSLIGEPRITFAQTPGEARARELLTQSAIDAIRRCTPARISERLGSAIAGRPIALRFIHSGPRGQGI